VHREACIRITCYVHRDLKAAAAHTTLAPGQPSHVYVCRKRPGACATAPFNASWIIVTPAAARGTSLAMAGCTQWFPAQQVRNLTWATHPYSFSTQGVPPGRHRCAVHAIMACSAPGLSCRPQPNARYAPFTARSSSRCAAVRPVAHLGSSGSRLAPRQGACTSMLLGWVGHPSEGRLPPAGLLPSLQPRSSLPDLPAKWRVSSTAVPAAGAGAAGAGAVEQQLRQPTASVGLYQQHSRRLSDSTVSASPR
jgi:hypothetical protein